MDVNDDLVLKENDRAKLDDIVSKMTNNKESDEDINFVVNDFKSKYGTTQDEVAKKKSTHFYIECGRWYIHIGIRAEK